MAYMFDDMEFILENGYPRAWGGPVPPRTIPPVARPIPPRKPGGKLKAKGPVRIARLINNAATRACRQSHNQSKRKPGGKLKAKGPVRIARLIKLAATRAYRKYHNQSEDEYGYGQYHNQSEEDEYGYGQYHNQFEEDEYGYGQYHNQFEEDEYEVGSFSTREVVERNTHKEEHVCTYNQQAYLSSSSTSRLSANAIPYTPQGVSLAHMVASLQDPQPGMINTSPIMSLSDTPSRVRSRREHRSASPPYLKQKSHRSSAMADDFHHFEGNDPDSDFFH